MRYFVNHCKNSILFAENDSWFVRMMEVDQTWEWEEVSEEEITLYQLCGYVYRGTTTRDRTQ